MKINVKNKNSDMGFEPQTLDFKAHLHLQPKNKLYGPLIFAKTLVCTFFLPNYLKIKGSKKWLISTFLCAYSTNYVLIS